jgi:hypothetical protein
MIEKATSVILYQVSYQVLVAEIGENNWVITNEHGKLLNPECKWVSNNEPRIKFQTCESAVSFLNENKGKY